MWALFKCDKTNNLRTINLSQVTYIESDNLYLHFRFTNTTVSYKYDSIDEAKEVYNTITHGNLINNNVIFSACEKK